MLLLRVNKNTGMVMSEVVFIMVNVKKIGLNQMQLPALEHGAPGFSHS
jgi:hypothetical protein